MAAGGSHSEQPGSAQTAEEGADFGANSPFEPEFDRVRSPERFGGLVGHSPPREGFLIGPGKLAPASGGKRM
ncbi:Uncharacterised protein [Mycobacteroides abscessus]|nr:Uncharacterised protein [Mycobacteroides abscessus]